MFKNLFVHQNKYIQKKQRVGRNIYDEEYSVTGWTLDSKTIFFFFLSHLQRSNGHGVIASSKLVARGLVTPVSSPIS